MASPSASVRPQLSPIEAVVFDLGGVVLTSPFEAFAHYEAQQGLPDGFIRRLNMDNHDGNSWAKLERGEIAVIETAQRWTADDQADLRLRHAADLVLAQAADAGLTDPARLHKLATWFDAANRTRDLLRTTVRADLAVAELLLEWPVGEQGGAKAKA